MAIRIRKIGNHVIALCAAKTKAESNDMYLDDNVHHALMTKFTLDLNFEGLMKKNPPIDETIAGLIVDTENNVV